VLTRCPTCQTTFRVTAEQLKARQGRVRCGQCQAIFNALETLIEEASSSVPPESESVVIHGFDVSPIGDTPNIQSPRVPEPPAAEAPTETTASPTQFIQPDGEEVDESDIEYVEIGELESGEDGEDAETLASADEGFDDELAETVINLEDTRALEIDDDFDAVASTPPPEPSPDDQFTKTVVGFTWYVEPESKSAPTDEPAADEFIRTVIAPWKIGVPETEPVPTEEPATDEFADTVIDRVRLLETEAPPPIVHEPDADRFADTMIEPMMRVAAFEPTAKTDDEPAVDRLLAQTVIEPLRVAEPEVTLELANEPAASDFTETLVEPHRVAESTTEEIADLEFDLAAIDDIHVEEVEEPPSVLDVEVESPHSFPALEPLRDIAEQPHYEPANAILQELESTAQAVRKPIHSLASQRKAAAEPLAAPEPSVGPELISEPSLSDESMPDLEADTEAPIELEPDLVPELQELPRRRRWPWVLAGLTGACLLAVQAIVHFRVELSVAMPRSKPALIAICDVLNCKVALPSQIDLIGIETSDLSPGPEGAGQLQLAATLRNRAPFVQTWPHLELTLTDAADKALVRRALGPTDYLPPGHKPDEGFPARSEQPVHLDLKAPGVPAVGYRLYVFYP